MTFTSESGSNRTVSIVVPTRDRPELVNRAIESALHQSHQKIEVIVVDDGSAERLRLQSEDERVRVIHLESSVGVCGARNVAMEYATGYWMVFLDDDDELLPHMVEHSMDAAMKSALENPVAVLSGMETVDADGRMLETRLPVSMEKGRHYFLESTGSPDASSTPPPGKKSFTVVCNTLFAPRYLLREIGGWDQSTSPTEHSDLMLRLNQVCSIEGVPVVTYRKTNHPGVQWHENLLARARGMEQVLAKHASLFALHRRKKAHFLTTIGMNYLKAGRWGRAILYTSRALVLSPWQPSAYLLWTASLGGPLALRLYRRFRGAVPAPSS